MTYSKKEKAALSRVGAAIRRLRKAMGMSQEELAFEADLDRTYVGSVERGERNIAVLNLMKIASALKVKPSELLNDDDKTSSG